MISRPRIAVIGLGIGTEHLEALSECAEDFEIVALCDNNDVLLKKLGERHDVALLLRRWEEVISRDDVDVVDICLPPFLHVPVAIAALRSGKSVVLEKPIATNLDDLKALVDATKASSGRLYPVFQYRYGKGISAVQALRRAGLLGEPVTGVVETHWARDASYFDVRWRSDPSLAGGGAIISHAIHAHDLLEKIAGPVEPIAAAAGKFRLAANIEDTVAVVFKAENGAPVSSSVTLSSAEDHSRFRLCFEHATLESKCNPYLPGGEYWRVIPTSSGDTQAIQECVDGFDDTPAGFDGFFSELAASLRGEEADLPTLEDGARSIELANKIHELRVRTDQTNRGQKHKKKQRAANSTRLEN